MTPPDHDADSVGTGVPSVTIVKNESPAVDLNLNRTWASDPFYDDQVYHTEECRPIRSIVRVLDLSKPADVEEYERFLNGSVMNRRSRYQVVEHERRFDTTTGVWKVFYLQQQCEFLAPITGNTVTNARTQQPKPYDY